MTDLRKAFKDILAVQRKIQADKLVAILKQARSPTTGDWRGWVLEHTSSFGPAYTEAISSIKETDFPTRRKEVIQLAKDIFLTLQQQVDEDRSKKISEKALENKSLKAQLEAFHEKITQFESATSEELEEALRPLIIVLHPSGTSVEIEGREKGEDTSTSEEEEEVEADERQILLSHLQAADRIFADQEFVQNILNRSLDAASFNNSVNEFINRKRLKEQRKGKIYSHAVKAFVKSQLDLFYHTFTYEGSKFKQLDDLRKTWSPREYEREEKKRSET